MDWVYWVDKTGASSSSAFQQQVHSPCIKGQRTKNSKSLASVLRPETRQFLSKKPLGFSEKIKRYPCTKSESRPANRAALQNQQDS
jgi:hypothetical protein